MQLYPNYFSISSQILVDRAKKIGFKTKIICPEKNFFSISRNNKTWFFKNLKSERTSAIALEIASDKNLTKRFLEEIGIDVVSGILWNRGDMSPKINFPVVLKPIAESHGTDVFTDIKNEKDLKNIAEKLFQKYDQILLEEFISGVDLRILCIAGTAKSAILRYPPFIVGDGNNSIENLIEIENRDLKRGDGHLKTFSKIVVDEGVIDFLASQNKSLQTILRKNEKQYLSSRANTSIGGTFQQIFKHLSSKNKEFAEKIAQKLNPNGFCAIDVLCDNPEKHWDEQVWKVLECEVAPGLRSHPAEILDEWLGSFK